MSEVLDMDKINNLLLEGFARGNDKAVRLLGVGVRFSETSMPEDEHISTKQLEMSF